MIAGLLILLAGCVHEFAWQLAAQELQGAVRDVTQWWLVLALCWSVHCFARERFLSAVCAVVAVMSSTTALCAAWWLSVRFEIVAGADGCSTQWGFPMLMLSALAALAAFFGWPHVVRR